jgi:deoxyadenosine/deoxycytidine kinase
MKYNFITIEGNIGAGKTTLATLLSEKLNTRLVLEEFTENPFLQKFYQKPEQFAFPVEMFFLAERYKQLKDLLPHTELFKSKTISDYLFTKCLLFAKVNLKEEEFNVFQKFFEIMQPQIPQPDLIIYLHTPVSKLQQQIKDRNRKMETGISNEYLFRLQETYTNYIRQHNINTLMIDTTDADFLNNTKHLNAVIEALDKDYENGPHYLTLPE